MDILTQEWVYWDFRMPSYISGEIINKKQKFWDVIGYNVNIWEFQSEGYYNTAFAIKSCPRSKDVFLLVVQHCQAKKPYNNNSLWNVPILCTKFTISSKLPLAGQYLAHQRVAEDNPLFNWGSAVSYLVNQCSKIKRACRILFIMFLNHALVVLFLWRLNLSCPIINYSVHSISFSSPF